jgi:hypothetical protein
MVGVTGYSQPLRAIGQALEVKNIQSFEMEPVGDIFIVRGSLPSASKSGEQNTQIELRYSLHDIDRLQIQGRSRRVGSGKSAEASSLSQILRCIDGYLHQKCARLLKLTRALDSVAVEYETSLGNAMKETFAVGDLYDLWVRMYLQRQERTNDR